MRISDWSSDVCSSDLLRDEKIEAVMHFAAYLQVGESIENPALYYTNNVVKTLGLLDAMVASGVGTLVFSSTAAVYGVPKTTPIPEDHPQRPINPYGETKLAIERALAWYGKAYGLKWAALRYFNAAGEIGRAHV